MTTTTYDETTHARTRPRAEARAPAHGTGIGAGVAAGLIGAFLMAAWSMSYAAAQGLGFWAPMKLVAGTWFGIETLIGGGGVILAGIATHLVMASVYGGIFGFLLPDRARLGTSVIAGLVYAGLVLSLMTFAVLPWLDPVMRQRVDLIWFSWIVTHTLFGLSLGLVPLFRHRGRG